MMAMACSDKLIPRSYTAVATSEEDEEDTGARSHVSLKRAESLLPFSDSLSRQKGKK